MEEQKTAASEAPPPAAHYPPPPPVPTSPHPYQKSPLLAAFLSFVPGLGNIYNGLYLRGLTFSVICVGIFALAVAEGDRGEGPILGLLIPTLFFFWFFNMIDAYRQATLINYGYQHDAEPLGEALSAYRQTSGGLVLGVAVFLLGLYGLLRHLFPDLDLTILTDFWYLAFLGFGGWLIYQAIQDRQTDTPASDDLYEEPVEDEAASSEAA